ncbi:hypothetical protein [Clostridium butyricum]|uniref:hypothetical protein n=1 Tax=Clostridium butyricum TaxID=1492 RepID=UPI002ABDFA96|nr:hypothetical protein [Clostridium butyricum]
MTLDCLVIEYNEKYNMKSDYKTISKKIHDLFLSINVEPMLFKEGKQINSAWNFPDSCKEDLLSLIKYIDIDDVSINRIKKGKAEKSDVRILKFCIDTIIKMLEALKYSDEEINEVRQKILKFTDYSFLNLKRSIQDLLGDIEYMYDNNEDELTLSDHITFENYAEEQIKKLQEHLRFTYYTMNSDKGILEMQKASQRIKKSDKDGALSDYLEKSMQVNKKVCEELGGLKQLQFQSEETIERKKEEIEIELFGKKLTKPPFVKHISEDLELMKVQEKDEEYQNILQEENEILNKKILIKSKMALIAKCEEKRQKRTEELEKMMFGDRTTFDMIEDEESENSVQLLKEGIRASRMFIVARQKCCKDDMPIMISMCDEFFEKKDDLDKEC